jgi:hypothetical protein
MTTAKRTASWAPDVWVTVESAGTYARFRRTGSRWLIESLRFSGSELLADPAQLVDANPSVVQYLEGLAHDLLEKG